MEKQRDHNQIMYMLGEVNANVKSLVKSQELTTSLLSKHEARLITLEKNEAVRVARSGIIGAVGGLFISTVAEWVRIKLRI